MDSLSLPIYPPHSLLSLSLFLMLGTESRFHSHVKNASHRSSISWPVQVLTLNPFSDVFLFHCRVHLRVVFFKCWIQSEILLIRKEQETNIAKSNARDDQSTKTKVTKCHTPTRMLSSENFQHASEKETKICKKWVGFDGVSIFVWTFEELRRK